MRSRRGVVSGGFRDSRDWLTLSGDLGSFANLLYSDDFYSPTLFNTNANNAGVWGNLADLSTGVGPNGRRSCVFNNTGLEFKGISSPVSGKDYSIEFWFKTTSSGGGWILSLGNSRGSFYLSSGSLMIGDPGTPSSISGLNDGEWHHVVRTNSVSDNRTYIDGVLEVVGTSTAVMGSSISFLGIAGLIGMEEYFFLGEVSSVAFYEYCLSPKQVGLLFHSQSVQGLYNVSNFSGEFSLNPAGNYINLSTLFNEISVNTGDISFISNLSFDIETTVDPVGGRAYYTLAPDNSPFATTVGTWVSDGLPLTTSANNRIKYFAYLGQVDGVFVADGVQRVEFRNFYWSLTGARIYVYMDHAGGVSTPAQGKVSNVSVRWR